MPTPKPALSKLAIAQWTAEAKRLRVERDRLMALPDTDKTRLPALRKTYEERARLLKPIAPLLLELIEGGALEFRYEREAEDSDAEAWLMFDVYDVELDKANGILTLLSFGIGPCSNPPPALENDEGESLLRIIANESEVFRVPVTSHLVVQERIDHGDHTHKNIRQIGMLADDFFSTEQSGDMEVIGMQPARRKIDAVFGIIAEDLKASDIAVMSLDALTHSGKIVLLGYEYDGERRQWLPELATLRGVMAHDREPGVVIDGQFRRLPRLDLQSPGDDDGHDTP
jgi:hypothetical protein